MASISAAPRLKRPAVPRTAGGTSCSGTDPRPTRTLKLQYLQDEPFDAPQYEREALAPGMHLAGPAIIREGLSTTFLWAGQRAEVGRLGEISIRRDPC